MTENPLWNFTEFQWIKSIFGIKIKTIKIWIFAAPVAPKNGICLDSNEQRVKAARRLVAVFIAPHSAGIPPPERGDARWSAVFISIHFRSIRPPPYAPRGNNA